MSNLTKAKLLKFLAFITAFIASCHFGNAFAEVQSLEGAMCKGYGIFSGPLGKTFAIFAIVALGIMLFLGKVSWGTTISITLAIGAIFGAPKIVMFLTGSSGVTCTQTGELNE